MNEPEIDFEKMARTVYYEAYGLSDTSFAISYIVSALRRVAAAQARRDAEIALREAEEWGNPEATEYQSAMRIAAAIRKEMGL